MTKDEFLEQIVFGWMKKDLVNISKVRTVIPGEGNANLPLAMLLVIYIDYLGSFLLGKYAGLEDNIREYLKCFKNPKDYPPELLNDLFRNGLAHDYFGRGGISRVKMRPPMVKSLKSGVILDADSLMDDFMDSLEEFKNRLTEENFMSRFAESKNDMEVRYEKHKSIIASLPIQTPAPISSPTIGASGASGTAVYSKDIEEM